MIQFSDSIHSGNIQISENIDTVKIILKLIKKDKVLYSTNEIVIRNTKY